MTRAVAGAETGAGTTQHRRKTQPLLGLTSPHQRRSRATFPTPPLTSSSRVRSGSWKASASTARRRGTPPVSAPTSAEMGSPGCLIMPPSQGPRRIPASQTLRRTSPPSLSQLHRTLTTTPRCLRSPTSAWTPLLPLQGSPWATPFWPWRCRLQCRGQAHRWRTPHWQCRPRLQPFPLPSFRLGGSPLLPSLCLGGSPRRRATTTQSRASSGAPRSR